MRWFNSKVLDTDVAANGSGRSGYVCWSVEKDFEHCITTERPTKELGVTVRGNESLDDMRRSMMGAPFLSLCSFKKHSTFRDPKVSQRFFSSRVSRFLLCNPHFLTMVKVVLWIFLVIIGGLITFKVDT
jgi:hypothetical protein